MRTVTEFIKSTVVGGIVFLVPLAIVLVVLGYAMRSARKIIHPIVAHLPVKSVMGVGLATLLSILVLLAIAFLAGLVARTAVGKHVRGWFEQSVLGRLPQYRMLTSMAEGMAKIESSTQLKPALVSIEGGWQVGYVLEALENDWVAVFLPQAPTPMSGNVMYMPADRVRSLNISMTEAMRLVRRIGLGSKEALKGVDLTQPAGA